MNNKLRKLIIIGAGGHGNTIYDSAKIINKWEKIFFLDDQYDLLKKKHSNVIGPITLIEEKINDDNFDFIIGIGNNEVRKKIYNLYFINSLNKLINLLHPSAFISNSANLKNGVVVFANSVISTHVEVGFCSIINNLSSIDHDVKIGNFVHISPGVNIAGTSKIDECVWIGIGSKVINNVSIGKNSIVGAGSIVLSNVKSDSKIKGIYKNNV